MDIPCKCGHLEEFHSKVYPKCFWCYSKVKAKIINSKILPYEHMYTPDNLLYIERIAKEKGLI
jgi:hypothetical protein